MSARSRMATWWKAVFRPGELERQVREELQFHIDSYAEDLMRSGISREEAMRCAHAELGSLAAGKENCRAAWGTRFFDELRADLRYAMRMLARSPGFTAIAVGSLALGIGANTVIFTAARHALLDRLHVPHPERLRLLWWSEPDNGVVTDSWGYFNSNPGGDEFSTSFSYPVYEQLRKENHSLGGLFAFKPVWRMTATLDGRAEAVSAEMVSGNYYSSLRIQPVLGRAIEETDDGAPGSGPVIVISDHFWATQFNRSARVIGKTIDINLTPMTIIGINPPGFTGAYGAQRSPDIFLPLSMQPIVAPMGPHSLLTDPDMWWVLVMGRVKAGVSDATAAANLNVVLNSAVRATMPVKSGAAMPHMELRDGSRGQNEDADWMGKPIYVLLGLAGFVLLLACANLANLLLARSASRQREMSLRLALGAGRGRILRQMITESLLVSLLGGAAGLLLGYSVRDAIPRLLSNSWQQPVFDATLDWQIFSFTAALSIATGLIFGLAPAWEAARVQVNSGLKEAAQTASYRRRGLAGKALVVVQVSLSMLLLVGAGLFVRTLIHLNDARLGFRPDQLLLFDIQPPAARYAAPKDVALHRELEEKLATVPGVNSVTLSRNPLIAGNISQSRVMPSGRAKRGEKDRGAAFNVVGERFFSTIGIPLFLGRGFDDRDTETSPKVAVINRELAREFFPNSNPIGQTFTTDLADRNPITIVGVCGDAKYARVNEAFRPTYYLPYRQSADPAGGTSMTYEISTRMKPKAIVPALRAAVVKVDRNLPLLDVRTQREQIDATMRQQRILANLTAGFGALALVLACIGVYGIMANAVARRTNEIGIRMALGAPPAQLLRTVLGEAVCLVLIGISAGVGGALALGRLVGSLLYGLKAWDPPTFAASAVLLLMVALAASWIPARRAAGVDPMQALRHE